MRRFHFLLFLPFAAVFLAFLPQKNGSAIVPHYGDLNAATPRDLPDELTEISAMLYEANSNSLVALGDEMGMLFQYPLGQGAVRSRQFFGRGDFEGLARVGNSYYALISNGNLVEFSAGGGSDVEGTEYKADFKGKTEFESLYYDASLRRLVLLCKECEEDKKHTVSAFFFDPVSKKYSSGALRFSTKDVRELAKGKDEPLRASDAAVNPVSGELYILASLNNLLLVVDARTGAFKRSYDLDKKLFKQPEGICFSPRGDLYISNESGGKGAATLLVYPYKP